MKDEEDLLDIIAKQRLTIYHQERRIEALEKSISQATQMNPNDIINQAITQLHTNNALLASKARIEQLEKENSLLKANGGRLCQVLKDIKHYANDNAINNAVIEKAIKDWLIINSNV